MRLAPSAGLVIASGVWAPLALAGNDDELFVGSQAAMTGGAVSAMVSDASATWYNPAGLGAVPLDQIDVSGTFYSLRAYSAPGFLSSRTGDSDPGSVIEFVSVPSQIAYIRRLSPGLSLGLGYFVPQASNLVLREGLTVELPRTSEDAEEERASWQLALSAVRVQHTAGLGLGFALSARVRGGFSLIGTYQNETQSVALSGLRTRGAEATAFVGTMQLGTASQLGLEAGAGFQIDLAPDWRLGVSLRSARLLLYQSVHVLGASGGAVSAGAETSIEGFMLEPRVSRTDFVPIRAGRAGLAMAHHGELGWAAFELDVQPGLYSESAGVDRQAVLNLRLGGYRRVSETVALGAGLFTDRSPDVLQRDALNAKGHFYGVSAGIELSDRHRLLESGRTDVLSFTSTFALKYAFSDGTFNDAFVDPDNLYQLQAVRGPLIVHELGFYVGAGLSY